MGTLTISLTSTPFTGSKSYTVSDSDVSRLIAYLQKFYGVSTAAQGLASWADDFVHKTTNVEQNSGITQTVPPPMVFT